MYKRTNLDQNTDDSIDTLSLQFAAMLDPEGRFRLRTPQADGIWCPWDISTSEIAGIPYLQYAPVPDLYQVKGVDDWGMLRDEMTDDLYIKFLTSNDLKRWNWFKADNTDGLLDDFIRLTTPTDIERFVREWGAHRDPPLRLATTAPSGRPLITLKVTTAGDQSNPSVFGWHALLRLGLLWRS